MSISIVSDTNQIRVDQTNSSSPMAAMLMTSSSTTANSAMSQQSGSGAKNFGTGFNQNINININNNNNNNNSSMFASSVASSPLLLSPSSPQTGTLPSTFTPTPTFYSDDDDNEEDTSKVIEDSPNGRWSKLKSEISSQKLLDFDSANLAIDSEKGCEMAWYEMRFDKQQQQQQQQHQANGGGGSPSKRISNRFESAETLRCIYEKLENILKFLVKFDHTNMLNVHDYWFVENEQQAKLVIITDYSTGSSLKRLFDAAMSKRIVKHSGASGGGGGGGHHHHHHHQQQQQQPRGHVKTQTGRRWLNQAIYLIRCLHNEGISLFQGAFTTETIFIQSCSVIKIAPSLLALNGLCVHENGVIRCNTSTATGPRIELNEEFRTKDMEAIGRLAIQIFTAHVKPSNSPGGGSRAPNRLVAETTSLDEFLATNLAHIDEPVQKDFVRCCFDAKTIDTIWFHPLLNVIYSLKVLSVYSILAYFQEKRQQTEMARQNSFSSTKSTRKSSSKLSQAFSSAGANADSSTGIYTLSECNDDDNFDDDTIDQPSEMNNNNNNNNSVDEQQNVNNNDQTTMTSFTSKNSTVTSSDDVYAKSSRPTSFLAKTPPLPTKKKSLSSNNSDFSTSETASSAVVTGRPPPAPPSSSGSPSIQHNLSYSNLFKKRQLTRKISLTFLTNVHDLKIPQDFFSLLEDIRAGLYPRLFKDTDSNETAKSIPSTQYIDFMIQHKQLMRRGSLSSQYELGAGGGGGGGSGGEEKAGVVPMRRFSWSRTRSIDPDVDLRALRQRAMFQRGRESSVDSDSSPAPQQQPSTPPSLKNYPIENRRIVKNECYIGRGLAHNIELKYECNGGTPPPSPNASNMVELALVLEFDDQTRRNIYSQFPVEFLEKLKMERASCASYDLDLRYANAAAPIEYLDYVMNESPFEDKLRKVAEHLAHELVDNGLINPKDLIQIADLFYNTIEESVSCAAARTAANLTADDSNSFSIISTPASTTSFFLSPDGNRENLLDDIFI